MSALLVSVLAAVVVAGSAAGVVAAGSATVASGSSKIATSIGVDVLAGADAPVLADVVAAEAIADANVGPNFPMA